MLDWYAARMMAWIGDLAEAGWQTRDTFPSERFPEYDHLVAVLADAPNFNGPLTVEMTDAIPVGNIPIGEHWTSAYADGTPQDVLINKALNVFRSI